MFLCDTIGGGGERERDHTVIGIRPKDVTSCVRVARAHRDLQVRQVQEDSLGLQDQKVWMDIQEKEDLEDLLGVQEVQARQEDRELKELLVTKEGKGSQVCQVRAGIFVLRFIYVRKIGRCGCVDCSR